MLALAFLALSFLALPFSCKCQQPPHLSQSICSTFLTCLLPAHIIHRFTSACPWQVLALAQCVGVHHMSTPDFTTASMSTLHFILGMLPAEQQVYTTSLQLIPAVLHVVLVALLRSRWCKCRAGRLCGWHVMLGMLTKLRCCWELGLTSMPNPFHITSIRSSWGYSPAIAMLSTWGVGACQGIA